MSRPNRDALLREHSCDMCGGNQRNVRRVTRAELRDDVAPWITRLCGLCRDRLRPRPPRSRGIHEADLPAFEAWREDHEGVPGGNA